MEEQLQADNLTRLNPLFYEFGDCYFLKQLTDIFDEPFMTTRKTHRYEKCHWRHLQVIVIQWFSTFFIPRPITATHYKPKTPIQNSNKANVQL